MFFQLPSPKQLWKHSLRTKTPGDRLGRVEYPTDRSITQKLPVLTGPEYRTAQSPIYSPDHSYRPPAPLPDTHRPSILIKSPQLYVIINAERSEFAHDPPLPIHSE